MKYYPFVKKWYKIKKHLNDQELNRILVEDFNKYTSGLFNEEFKAGMFPRDFESCDWDCDYRGRRPEFWKYVRHAACHWVVNFNLRLAMIVEPNRKWRIISSQEHSTVWDGDQTLFDMNFSALGVDPDEAFNMANKRRLKIGSYKKTYLAQRS
jgi:hypothetical protein